MRAKPLCAVVIASLISGGLVAATAGPAGAVLVEGVFEDVQCTTNPNVGTQLQDIPYGFDAPAEVDANSTFEMTFPGGTAALPAVVLGFVPVAYYKNLATSYQVEGGTFVQASFQSFGDTLINGTPTAAAHDFPAADTLRMSTVGPIPPGDLTTPDRSIQVTAGDAGTPIKVFEKTLTTTVGLGNPPTEVTATCPVPPTVLLEINVVDAGPQTVVNAGPDVSGDAGTAIALNGSYEDPFGTPSLLWTIDSPDCDFADATAAVTTVTCTEVGTFVATLTADDGPGHPLRSDTALVTVTTPNIPPTVNAGPNVSGEVNEDIALNGSVTDPDNSPSIQWTIDNPNCTFGDDTDPETTVNCTVTGTFAATLTADDGINVPVSDTANVTVNPPPPGLNVSAGPDVEGLTNTPIPLDGKVTDPGFTPTVLWVADTPGCTFANATAVDTTITCTTPGVVAATLTATDGVHPNDNDTALVTVREPNAMPFVDAGPDVTGVKNTPIPLDGTVIDTDSTPTVHWTADTPGCTFANPNVVDTTITCTATGVVAATLTADDVLNDPVSDVAIVTVLGNAPPTVNAGNDAMTGVDIPALLDGSVSDPDNSPTVQWSTGSPFCTFGSPNATDTTITCTEPGIVAATLTASDGVNTPVSDTALVTVNPSNFAPEVSAGPDQTVGQNHAASLPGLVTDPDNTPTVHWATGNPACSFGNANVQATTVTCTAPGIYAVTLTADDGVNPPVSDTALITVVPPLCTGVCVAIGDAVVWEGGVASLPVTLNQVQTVAVTVKATIGTFAGGAINGYGLPTSAVQDFKKNPVLTVKIAAGARVAYVAVTALKDALDENDEGLNVTLSDPLAVGGPTVGIGRPQGTATIKDAFGVPDGTLLVGSSSIVELDACATCKAMAKINIVLTGPKATVSVKYSSQAAGATAGTDYQTKTNANLAFTTTSATQKSISINTIGDNTPENTEGINIVFSNPVGVPLPANGHIDIIDND